MKKPQGSTRALHENHAQRNYNLPALQRGKTVDDFALVSITAGSLPRLWSFFRDRLRKPTSELNSACSKAVPFACFLDEDQERRQHLVPVLLSFIMLWRRLTASLPDDPTHGPARNKQALLYRLLYGRNTSR